MRHALLVLASLLAASGGLTQPLAAESPEAPQMRVLSIAAGEQHSVAVLEDGSVWTWGLSGNGQLGREVTIDDYWLPRRAPDARGQLAAAGGSSSFVLQGDTLWSTGYNHDGRLGWGPTTDEQLFTPHPLPGVVDLDSRGPNSYALMRDSTLWAWGGEGTSGQMGNGTTPNRQIEPVRVDLDKPVVAFSAGAAFGMAVHDDGTLSTWGHNYYGTLGVPGVPSVHATVTVTEAADGASSVSSSGAAQRTQSDSPVRVRMVDAIAVAAGGGHALALAADSTVWGWGTNRRGALAQAEHESLIEEPIQIEGLTSVVAIAAGDEFSLALKADGSVWMWGVIDGSNGYEPPMDRIRRVPGLSGIAHIEAGQHHAFAISASGDLWGWGLTDQGQVGAEESEGGTDWPPLRVRFPTR